MQAYRASILRFDAQGAAVFDQDGMLVVGHDGSAMTERIVAVGAFDAVAPLFPGLAVEHLPGRIIAPGFVDMHVHYPQVDVIGSPASGLLPWLENYTFPQESRFADPNHAAQVATFFVTELLRNGVTTALTFATSHPASVDAFFREAQRRRMRMIGGKVLQDRHSPDGVRDETAQSLRDTEALIERWHGVDRLGYAITPRFAPSCSAAQLRGAGELAARHPSVWIQSHVAENADEIAWARQLFPAARSYLAIYDGFGLMRTRSVYAHCIHFDDADRALMRDTGATAAICPTSNLFLGSGFFDYAAADRVGFRYGLASDVGGGTSLSPFRTMLAAYYVAREGQTKTGLSLTPQQLWWQHTAGAAQALGLDGVIGNLQPGCEADFIVLQPHATALLERRTRAANTLNELLFAMIVLGDDRLVERAVIASAAP
ncbi:MAG: guanine deaminase [Burkholderiaceae bacterium]